jgi:predicted site-specific integrase-resolvase
MLKLQRELAKQCYHQNATKMLADCFTHGCTDLKKGTNEMLNPDNLNKFNKRNIQPLKLTWNVEIPLSAPCQIYPRVSTPEQKNNVSAEMQKDKSFALSCGWTEDLIILDDRDLGVSGQLRMEERLAFNDMLRRIANGSIKAVVVVNVDRLFRIDV